MQNLKTHYGERKPTYIVIAEGGAAPKRGHPSRIKARNEAGRLARANPGVKFHVVKLKETMVYEAPETVTRASRPLDFETQVFARARLSKGGVVRVKEDHYQFAGRTGILQRMGDLDENDTSVYVQLSGDDHETRFSPSSLIHVGASEKSEAKDEMPSFGNLIGGILARVLLDAVLAGGDKEEPTMDHKPEAGDLDELADDIRRVAGFRPGDELYLVMEPGVFPFVPSSICKARFISSAGALGDPRFALIDLTEADGPPVQEANISRLFLRSDPMFADARPA